MNSKSFIGSFAAFVCLTLCAAAFADAVTSARVPDGGIQPQAAMDGKGVIHLIYLKGEAAASDIFYVRSSDAGRTWSSPVRVNDVVGSAIAIGTMRGPHLAVGPDGRPHVAWMGSAAAQPRGPSKATPMLYTRLAKDGKAFEPQRNVLTERVGLDGGGSIAVNRGGVVFVAWHAPFAKGEGEARRVVWVAESRNGGGTFAKEEPLGTDPVGACGCCGMRLLADGDRLIALFRSATEDVHRDMCVLRRDGAARPQLQKVAPVTIGTCLLSTCALTPSPHGIVAAWETNQQVQWGVLDRKTRVLNAALIHDIPGRGDGGRKHPAIAVDEKGRTLIAWTEGTGWKKGGSVVWQLFGADGKPIESESGRKKGLPVWSLPAAVATAPGSFLILY